MANPLRNFIDSVRRALRREPSLPPIPADFLEEQRKFYEAKTKRKISDEEVFERYREFADLNKEELQRAESIREREAIEARFRDFLISTELVARRQRESRRHLPRDVTGLGDFFGLAGRDFDRAERERELKRRAERAEIDSKRVERDARRRERELTEEYRKLADLFASDRITSLSKREYDQKQKRFNQLKSHFSKREEPVAAFGDFVEREELRIQPVTKKIKRRAGIIGGSVNRVLKTPMPQTGQRIRYEVFNVILYGVLGLACMFLVPFFGLPQMLWLAISFFLLAFYTFLPNEGEIREFYGSQRGKQKKDEINFYNKQLSRVLKILDDPNITTDSEEYKRALDSRDFLQKQLHTLTLRNIDSVGDLKSWLGLLLVKSLIKIAMYGFAIWQFFLINHLIAIVLSFAFYFSLPGRYNTDQINKMFESWMRPVMAFVLGLLFWVAFGANVGLSLGLMVMAFFFAFPTVTEVTNYDTEEMHARPIAMYSGSFDKLLFISFMAAALFYSGAIPGLGMMKGDMQLVFWIIWIISLISGYTSGPEGRPAIGSLMIIVALFVFSTTFTGIMGQAVFGYWWPQVYGTMEAVGDFIGPVWEQATAGIGDTWTIMTNPAAYYEMMMRRQQASTTRLETGGSPLSIEMSRFELFTSVMGILDPQLDSIVGIIELENMGEFNAENIEAEVWAEWTDVSSMTMEGVVTGTVTKLECSKPSDIPSGSIPAIAPNIATCKWTKPTVPDEIRFLSFVFGKNSWSLPDGNLNDLKEPEELEESEEVVLIDTFEHGAEMVKIKLNFTYDYDVNVSIPVEVIDDQLYKDLLNSREIILQELTSKYTGGPAKATIWSQKQPVRDEEKTLFVASLYNDGSGDIKEIYSFKVLIPLNLLFSDSTIEYYKQQGWEDELETLALGKVEGLSHTFDHCFIAGNPELVYVRFKSIDEPLEIECVSTKPLSPTNFRRVSFFLEPLSLTEKIKKTSSIVGLATYRYEKDDSEMLTIANAPMH